MKGRPRKPTAAHLKDGTFRADRQNLLEPQYPAGVPEKPPAVAARKLASDEWDRICPIMTEQRTIAPAFRVAVEMYCLAYADVLEAEQAVMTLEDPELRADAKRERERARKELRQWTVECGLSQASAGKVSSAPAAKEVSPLAALEAKRAAFRRIG